MVTIEVYASIKGHVVSWLFDGDDEENALKNAMKRLRKNGLRYRSYVLVG